MAVTTTVIGGSEREEARGKTKERQVEKGARKRRRESAITDGEEEGRETADVAPPSCEVVGKEQEPPSRNMPRDNTALHKRSRQVRDYYMDRG